MNSSEYFATQGFEVDLLAQPARKRIQRARRVVLAAVEAMVDATPDADP